MPRKKIKWLAWVACALLFPSTALCATGPVRILVASSAKNTGIVAFLVAQFKELRPDFVCIIEGGGTLHVLNRGREGNADITISHFPEGERYIMEEKIGIMDALVMYNQFTIAGPETYTSFTNKTDVFEVLRILAEEEPDFIGTSRLSGTHQRWQSLWRLTGLEPDWPGYNISNISSQGALRNADAMGAFTFIDMGTYLINRSKLSGSTVPLFRDHAALRNYYRAILYDMEKFNRKNNPDARGFFQFLFSPQAQQAIADYGVAEYGAALYIPAAQLDRGLQARTDRLRLQEKTRHIRQITLMSYFLAFAVAAALLLWIYTLAVHRRVERSEHRFKLAVEGTDDGIWDWELNARVYYSPRCIAILELSPNEHHWEPLRILKQHVYALDRPHVVHGLSKYMKGKADDRLILEFRYQTGNDLKWLLLRCRAIQQGGARRLSGSITDISDRKIQESLILDLEHKALHDPLTDLPNRAVFTKRAAHTLHRAQNNAEPFAIMVMDLDEFKNINDHKGHLAGDRLLRAAAVAFRRALPDDATVVRLGGDEFAALIPAMVPAQATRVTEQVQAAFAQEVAGGSGGVSFSCGMAFYPHDGDCIDTLFQRADENMYANKKAKKTAGKLESSS